MTRPAAAVRGSTFQTLLPRIRISAGTGICKAGQSGNFVSLVFSRLFFSSSKNLQRVSESAFQHVNSISLRELYLASPGVYGSRNRTLERGLEHLLFTGIVAAGLVNLL